MSSRTVRRRSGAALASAALACAALVGCSSGGSAEAGGSAESSAASTAAAGTDGTQSADTVLAADEEAHDGDPGDVSDAVEITLKGAASVAGEGADVDGSTVTITSGGTYRISGTLTDGRLVVDAADATVTLVLDGARISSSKGAAVAATAVDRLVVVLADGSTNTLSDAGSYADGAEADAALFSAGDLTVAGGGTLTVKGNGNDGIVSKDGLVVASGTVTVTAADDGIRGKDYLVVEDGEITVTAGGDGLKADNEEDADAGYVSVEGGTLDLTAGGDGVAAATDLVVTGGRLTVGSGGGSGTRPADDISAKGLKSGIITVLEGGTVAVDASDDAVHSDGAVHLAGATVSAASGDDGVHAEGDLVVDRGTVKVTRASEGIEGGNIVVGGGSVSVVSSDDGVNASGSSGSSAARGGGPGGGGGGESVGDYRLTVTGGTLLIDAEGDGLDSNGTAEITGGTVVVNGPQQGGNGALDVNGSFTVSGGTLLAAGSSGMAVAPDEDSAQGWLSATLDSSVPAGTTLHVVDADGKVVATYVTAKQIQNVVYSSSAIESGAEYQVWSGGSAATESTGGLAAKPGTLGDAERIATVTAGDAPQGGGFGGGGGPGGGRG
ncbi:carbohydrate-binding domain-containing protein [Streptomyces phaeofaciens JCM 4814]|uniref:Carbohydrate-binding domain-containing protein n=1 Tax=Streptomyces phaeofaciens TaxID=68254 RepID=A0A918HKN9_9ACTN|nr:carbohydrate-binding domain-containing protein [Streptomyces phaeofaciens]GGT74958.1 hypothetical protein GCM10010226_61250 [Streptomyces phaeofaciens]